MAKNKPDLKYDPKQTDPAEGGLETVEESIRIHEKKGDQQGRPAEKTRHAG